MRSASLALLTMLVQLPLPAAEQQSPLEQAQTLRAAGRFDEALDALRVESREIKRIEGDGSPRLLVVNDLAAEILVDQGSLDKAADLLEKTIAQREKLIATGRLDQNLGLGASLLTVSRLDILQKRYPEAAEACRRAVLAFDAGAGASGEDVQRGQAALTKTLGMLDELLGPTATATQAARERAAETYESLGMYPAAIAERRQLLDAILDASPPDAHAAIEASNRLSRIMLQGGLATEAAAVQARTIDAVGPADTPGSDRQLEAVALLAELQLAAESFVLAEGTLGDLWETVVAAKKDSSRTGLHIRLLGLLAKARAGRVSQLPEWFAAAVNALGRGSALETAAGAEGLMAAAEIRNELGLSDQSTELLTRAAAIAQAAKTADPGLIASCSARLANAALAAGDVPAARKVLARAVPAAESALGPGDPGLAGLRVANAECLIREAKVTEARDLAVRILERGLPRPSTAREEEFVAVFDRLADKANTSDLDLRERFLEARARQFGADHPFVAAAAQIFGAARLAAGDWSQAIALLDRAADLQQKALGEDHPDRAATLLLLGHAQLATGAGGEAAATLLRSRETWSRAVGDSHPGTLAAMEALALALIATGDREGAEDLLRAIVEADSVNADGDSIAKASHLVRLADLLASHDETRSRECLDAAVALPCWTEGRSRDGRDTRRLALTAALAAHAFGLLGDRDQAAEMLRRGRALAVELGDSRELLERLETTAAKGDVPPRRS